MTWQLQGNQASFLVSGYQGTVDLTVPQNGVVLVCQETRCMLSPILGVSLADAQRVRIQDSYTRLDDLVATYPQTSHRPFNIQLQYRIFNGGQLDSTQPVFGLGGKSDDLLLMEQWISNSTYLLDSHPQIDLELFPIYHDSIDSIQVWQDIDGEFTPLATAQSDGANIAAVVSQPIESMPALAVLVHPLDQSDADFSIRGSEDSDVVGVAMLRMFDRFMEKGVIRRARIRLIVSKEAISDELLQMHYADFAKSPLPLTT
jgi:hypothetical protein